MNTFIDDVIESIEELNQRKNEFNGLTAWTIAVKKALIDVAEKHELAVCCKMGSEKYKHNQNLEWLYDLIMYNNNNEIFNEVFLICESEWNPTIDEILWDFEKLLFARSKVRLMVFEVTEENYMDYKNTLINIIEKSNSSLNGDIYLFAIWHLNSDPDGFIVEKYIKGEQ